MKYFTDNIISSLYCISFRRDEMFFQWLLFDIASRIYCEQLPDCMIFIRSFEHALWHTDVGSDIWHLAAYLG